MIHKKEKTLIFIGLVVILLVSVTSVLVDNNISKTIPKDQIMAEKNTTVTESEKEDIQKYIDMIYGFYISLPEFDDINNANDDWTWAIVLDYLEDTSDQNNLIKYFTSSEAEAAAKTIFGDNFNKKLSKDSSRYVKYFEDEDRYCSVGMGVEMHPWFVIKSINNSDNQYAVEIVEYVWGSMEHHIIYDSEHTKIASFEKNIGPHLMMRK